MAARVDVLPSGTDVVIRANPVAAQANSALLSVELDNLLSKVTARLKAVRA
jgi:ribonuclease P protein component